MTGQTHDADASPALREPANLVSPRALSYWRVTEAIYLVITGVALVVLLIVLPSFPWWAWLIAAVVIVPGIFNLLVAPPIRYRIHRWEITDEAVFTRSGWINTEQRIAPLSRVQTVDSKQSFLMRMFHLASITVTTASAAGPITIECLDADEARQLVATLTTITSATTGDAT